MGLTRLHLLGAALYPQSSLPHGLKHRPLWPRVTLVVAPALRPLAWSHSLCAPLRCEDGCTPRHQKCINACRRLSEVAGCAWRFVRRQDH
jgi:hypothetical protein